MLMVVQLCNGVINSSLTKGVGDPEGSRGAEIVSGGTGDWSRPRSCICAGVWGYRPCRAVKTAKATRLIETAVRHDENYAFVLS
jgi:hypothetical protein